MAGTEAPVLEAAPVEQTRAMKLSVVVPTLGRRAELSALLASLRRLPQDRLEVLVIDQNPPGFLDEVIEGAGLADLRHFRVDFRGTCRAKNFGLRHVTGDVVNFCDDDATVDPRAYEVVEAAFAARPEVGMLTFKVVDPDTGAPCMVRFASSDVPVDPRNFNTVTIEFSQFWRVPVIEALGGYDETLGVGAYFGAEESMDLVIRALRLDVKMQYVDEVLFRHPNKAAAPLRRYYEYARGTGRIAWLHGTEPFVARTLGLFVAKSVVGAGLYGLWKPRASMRYLARLGGFAVGFANSVAGRHVEPGS